MKKVLLMFSLIICFMICGCAKNTKKEIFIMSPWIRENVINDEFLSEIKRLKESNCKVKIIFIKI